MINVVPERQNEAFEKELGARQLFEHHNATRGPFNPCPGMLPPSLVVSWFKDGVLYSTEFY